MARKQIKLPDLFSKETRDELKQLEIASRSSDTDINALICNRVVEILGIECDDLLDLVDVEEDHSEKMSDGD